MKIVFNPCLPLMGILLIVSFTATGQTTGEGYYVTADFVAGLSDIDGVTGVGPIPTNATETDLEDEVGGLGFGIGYRRDAYRLELEYVWRHRFDLNALFGTLGVDPTVTRYSDDLRTHSLMANAYWDFHNDSAFTPYIVGSLGWVFHESETEKLSAAGSESNETSADNVGWGIGAGITYEINSNWKATIEYKYMDLGEAEIAPFPTGDTMIPGEYTSNDLSIGIRYEF